MKLFVTLLVLLVVVVVCLRNRTNPKLGPKYIVVIRHGEKPHNPGPKKQKLSNSDFLNEKGKKRAEALVQWVSDTVPQTLTGGLPIEAVYTPEPGPFGEDSRPRQTVSLLTFQLNLPLYGSSRYFDTDSAAREILNNPYYNDRAVLVCWEHTCIQKLVSSLCGLTTPYWQSDDFSSVVVLTKQDSGLYNMSLSCESVLDGDNAACETYTENRLQTCTTY